ncbi:TRAP transporter small permease [Sedimentibacter sp.]|uniref:TRAP transporter small permease n=1 Tax=Sedimentibacter sp. TaxID=1960295 RepID=UPI000EBDADBD|nr:TRAP transporter small permease [Sedimentibacter sp.]HCX61859.1 TRAP transporter small permease [Clostridiales bacterium]
MKILKFIDDNLEKIILVILLGATSVVIGLQVFMRYVLQSSLSWSEEIARYMFVWLTYIGISYGVKADRHIKVDAAMYMFPKNIRKYVALIGDILFLAFAIIIVVTSYGVSGKIIMSGQTSPAVGLPMGLVYLAPFVGFAMVSLRLVQNIIKHITLLKGEDIQCHH